jgi:hypothetical protein
MPTLWPGFVKRAADLGKAAGLGDHQSVQGDVFIR